MPFFNQYEQEGKAVVMIQSLGQGVSDSGLQVKTQVAMLPLGGFRLSSGGDVSPGHMIMSLLKHRERAEGGG